MELYRIYLCLARIIITKGTLVARNPQIFHSITMHWKIDLFIAYRKCNPNPCYGFTKFNGMEKTVKKKIIPDNGDILQFKL